jgi:hypothetical protein
MAEQISEKVVRLETQMTNITGEIAEIKSLVKEVIVKVDNMTNLQNEVQNLKVEVSELKKRTFRNGWLFPVLTALAMGIIAPTLTVLILNYVSHRGQ